MQLWVPETRMVPKEKNVTIPLNLHVRIPKGLMGWNVPSHCLTKLWLTVNGTVLSSSLDSPIVLYLCSSKLHEWEWTEGAALARIVLLLAIWIRTVDKPNV